MTFMDASYAFVKKYIDTAIQNDALNHAYIFEGAKGTGRKELAIYTAKSLLCTEKNGSTEPCGKCHACRLIDSGSHPDCVIVRHEKPTTLSVAEVREQVVDDTGIRPYYGGRKVYIIPDAELMNNQSQNALLKTIEEPPAYVLIILIATDKGRLLPTINSRCVALSFRGEPEFHTDDEEIKDAFREVEDLVSRQGAADTASAVALAKKLAGDKYKEYLPDLFELIERMCRNSLLVKSGADLTDKGAASYIDKTAAISYEGLEQILKETAKAKQDIIRTNVAAEAVLDSLFLHILQVRAG